MLADGPPDEILDDRDLLIRANLIHEHLHEHGGTRAQPRPRRRAPRGRAVSVKGVGAAASTASIEPTPEGEPAPPAGAWSDVRDRLRARGLRWTPQRRLILDVLGATDGHVTGSEIVERCRAKDPETTPVDGVPDARRPRGARLPPPQPRGGRPRGVPRPPARRARPPALRPLQRLMGDPDGRGALAGRGSPAFARLPRPRRPSDDHRRVCRVLAST